MGLVHIQEVTSISAFNWLFVFWALFIFLNNQIAACNNGVGTECPWWQLHGPKRNTGSPCQQVSLGMRS